MNEHIGVLMVDRIRRIKQVIEAFEAGDTSATRAISLIEDIASGDSERIVRVGNLHKPEIET